MEHGLAAVGEAAASSHSFEMLVLAPAVAASLDPARPARLGPPTLVRREGLIELGLDDRWPVVVVRGEDAASPQDARRFCKCRLRLHPVERLRTRDDVGT